MNRQSERGAVSLFIVIFTALIVTVVTVSFTQLMIANQQQATNNDLSQRAYDSATAGVEDAKRLLVLDAKCGGGPNCNVYNTAISNRACNTIQAAGLGKSTVSGPQNSETQVGVQNDNQGYTCVIINQDTPSYVDSVSSLGPVVIPLQGVSPFDTIRISWFSPKEDLHDGTLKLSLPSTTSTQLPSASNWQSTTPPMLRAQFIPGSDAIGNLNSDAKTAFLYPESSQSGGSPIASFAARATATSATAIGCSDSPYYTTKSGNQYACQATLSIGNPTSSAFLQLASIYNVANFEVELLSGNTVVNFHNVQPTVDSTGRASDVFRRVLAHVTVTNGLALPYPDATLNVGNNLCKTFFVTTNTGDYNAGSCDPSKNN